MYSTLSLLITIAQIGIIGYGLIFKAVNVLFNLLLYGSPLHLMMTLFTDDSVMSSNGWLFILLFIFHALKYALMVRARFVEDFNNKLGMAVLLEVIYLLICAYVIFPATFGSSI